MVLSDETLKNLAANDPVSAAAIHSHFAYWDDIAVCLRGERIVSTGHGFCGIGRRRLLELLKERAIRLGVEIRFETRADDPAPFAQEYDLVVAADGLHSRVREAYREHFRPDLDVRRCKFVWLGTRQKFDDAFTFIFEETGHGWVWAHAYQFDSSTATFIVECSQATWKGLGFESMSQAESAETCRRIFAAHLDGHPLMSNATHLRGSAWLNFPRVLCEKWSHRNVVLLGDAAATAPLLDRLRHQARDGGGGPPRRGPGRAADPGGGVRTLRGEPARGGAPPPVRGPQLPRLVRGRRAVHRPSIPCSSTTRC